MLTWKFVERSKKIEGFSYIYIYIYICRDEGPKYGY